MPAPKGVYRASDRALGMGEMGRANRTNRSNRCNRSNNKVCEGCTYIDRMRWELSVAVACSLWLDRWELGRAGVGAVVVWGRELGRAGWWCLWSGRWGVGRARVGLVGGVRGGALGRGGR